MFRFIHTSDLHLGKRFGQFSADLPEYLINERLTNARHQAIETLARLAKENQASAILVAGDVFDIENPSLNIIKQALNAMAEIPNIKWVLLPGNHDSLSCDELWKQVQTNKPDNVLLAFENSPLEIEPNRYILPAPCQNRRAGQDLTHWMDEAQTPKDALRIGLAHGAIQSFGEDDVSDVISPNRAKTADLDYLALGDWHGQLKINERTWYSGTPETDRFKDNISGKALLVSIPEKGIPPTVTSLDTGLMDWQVLNVNLLPGEDFEQKISSEFPPLSKRRNRFLQINLSGRLKLSKRVELNQFLAQAAPDFAWFDLRDEGLNNEYDVVDLDRIDQAGALRDAAEKLLQKAQQDEDPNSLHGSALSLLYNFAGEVL